MSTDRTADYAVGYGKPPVATRFKKGNRAAVGRGRPRGATSLAALLREALEGWVVVTEGGRRRKIARYELGIAQLADKFAKADPASLATATRTG
jgi:Family of unknown function (DUF5681)